jgi:pseudaminic acid biosynthesis-associated methylase
MDFWKSKFGEDYTERNTHSMTELDSIYKEQYGYTRSEMNKAFIKELGVERTLEVGCNVGNILLNLQSIGLESLYGIELQHYAVERSKIRCQGINIIQGSAFDIPFKNSYFDLVFTSGVLIHLSPEDIKVAMDEMHRVSNKYIWGFEYYADQYTEIEYQGNENRMWKTNFAQLFLDRYDNLRLVKDKKYPYLKNGNIDHMYLLEKIV